MPDSQPAAAMPVNAVEPAREPEDGRSSRELWWALAVTLAAAFMSIIDSFIVNVAIPSIRTDLHASFAEVELAAGGYVLAYGLLLVMSGRLGDGFGYKRVFIAGIVVFSLASLACGLAPNPTVLIVFRLVQGCGAALYFPQVLTFIQTTFTGPALVRAFAVFSGIIGLAAIAGQLVGGALISANLFGLQWRPIFLINIVIGGATALGAAHTLPSRPSAARPGLDLTGVLILAATLLLVLIPLADGQSAGWPLWTWLMLALFPVAMAGFLRWERRLATLGANPLVNPAMFRNRSFTAGNAVNFAFFAGSTGLYFVLTVHLQGALHYSPWTAGLTFTPLAATFGLTSLLVPRASKLLGRRLLPVAYAINGIGALALLVTAILGGDRLTNLALAPALAVIGIGEALGVSPLLSTILGEVPKADAGAASGVLETVGQVAMSFGISTLGLIYTATRGATGLASAAAFDWALVANLLITLTATVLVTRLGHRSPAGRAVP